MRHSCEITVPELPWPLRFYFVLAQEPDGSSVRYVCVGFEIGTPVPSDKEKETLGGDTDDYELSMARFSVIARNFLRYRRIAEQRLDPTEESVLASGVTRAMMHRRKGGQWTREEHALLVADYLALQHEPDPSYALAEMYELKERSSVWRQLQICEQEGLIPKGVLKHRK